MAATWRKITVVMTFAIALLFTSTIARAADMHLGVTIKTQNVVQLENAVKNIDKIPKNAEWVRLDLGALSYDGKYVRMNSEYERYFWQLLHDLRDNGKKIWLIVGVPAGTTKDNYKEAIDGELMYLSDILPYVDTIQIGNEMDCHDFIGYKPVSGCDWKNYDDGKYISRVLYFVSTIGDYVQKYNATNIQGRNVKIAVNLTSWPLLNGRTGDEIAFVRELSNYVNTVGLDLYPDTSYELVPVAQNAIYTFKKEGYGVFVTETGMSAMQTPPNCPRIYTEEKQAEWLPKVIETLAQPKPEAIMIYMLQDLPTDSTDCQTVREAHFGLIRADGTKKPAYYTVFRGSAPEQNPIQELIKEELKRWYPDRGDGKWEFNVLETVQKVYPDATYAMLEGDYDILDYWQVDENVKRTPEEIVSGWEEGYEIAKLNVDGNWYFVRIPAKLTSTIKEKVSKAAVKITSGPCNRGIMIDGQRIEPLGVSCVEYNVTAPENVKYTVIVRNAKGQKIKTFEGAGLQTFQVTWPLNPTVPNYEDLVPTCAEVVVDGNTVAETGDCRQVQERQTMSWNVSVRSPYEYTYRIEGNTLYLTIFVNYTARNSCEGVYAKVEPLRCPNCYEVDILEGHAGQGEICAQVIRHIPTVSVKIPLSAETNTALIEVKTEYETPVRPQPSNPLICMRLEANVLRIKNMIESCKMGCTDDEKTEILEQIKQLKERAKELNCNIAIPKPVFPPTKEPQPIPPKKILPELNKIPEKNTMILPQPKQTPTLPKPTPVVPILQIFEHIHQILAHAFRIW